MEIKKSHSENKAVYVREDELQYFHEFLSEMFANVNYRARCVDDSTIEFKSLEELLSYENPDFRKIKCIEIFGDNEDSSSKYYNPYVSFKNNFEFSLGSKYSSQTMSYDFHFNDLNKANRFESELKSRLKEIRPWYWFLAKFDFFLGISSVWFIFSMISGISSIKEKIGNQQPTNTPDLTINEYLVLAFIGVGLVFAISYPLNKIKNYLFPKTVIELGRQKKKNRLRLQIIYLVVAVILLGLLLNVLGGFIYDYLRPE